MNEVDSQKKENVTWTVPMDKAMLDTLREQTLLGNKGKGGNAGWKGPSFVAISNAVQPLCQQKISKANIQNRIKTMKKSKKGVEELLKLSGFGWSSSRNMVITEDPEWDELIQARPKLKFLRNKSVDLYLEMVEVFGDEPAVGDRETTTNLTTDDESNTNEGAPSTEVDVDCDSFDVGGNQCRSSSSKRGGSVLETRNKRNRSISATLSQEMTGVRVAIENVANAMAQRNNMDDNCWKDVKKALGTLQLDTETKINCLEWFHHDVERRRFFLTMEPDEQLMWIESKLF